MADWNNNGVTIRRSSPKVTCYTCGKGYFSTQSLIIHRHQNHSDDYKCLLCKKFLSSVESPKHHLRSVHGIQKPSGCQCCDWIFKNQCGVIDHNLHLKKNTLRSSAPLIISNIKPGQVSKNGGHRAEAIDLLTFWHEFALRNVTGPPLVIAPEANLTRAPVVSTIPNHCIIHAVIRGTTSSASTSVVAAPDIPTKKKKSFMIQDILDLA